MRLTAQGQQVLCEKLEHQVPGLCLTCCATRVSPSPFWAQSPLSGMRTVRRLDSISPACQGLVSRACGQMRDVDVGELALEDPPPPVPAEARVSPLLPTVKMCPYRLMCCV